MRRRKGIGIWWLTWFGVCAASSGCEDAVREGAINGVTTGVSNVIVAIFDAALDRTAANP